MVSNAGKVDLDSMIADITQGNLKAPMAHERSVRGVTDRPSDSFASDNSEGLGDTITSVDLSDAELSPT